MISLNYNGKRYENWSEADLLSVGIPQSEIDAAKDAIKWVAIRKKRAPLLVEADALVNVAEDAGDDSSAVRAYRQALRDIPQSYSSPDTVIWPEKPSV